jgi:hypothetical protein
MATGRGRSLTRAAIVVLTMAPAVWYACSDHPDAPAGPLAPRTFVDLRGVVAVQRRHTQALLEIPGIIGTAITGLPDGRAGLMVLAERPGIAGLPIALEGVPLKLHVSGRIMAMGDPTRRQRPAPLGSSVGHPLITAGTIGARVRDAQGRVYILSNNHVLANSNGAAVGDAEYQPGPFDGGTAADQIATLSDFQAISFSAGTNTMDAAVALSSIDVLDNAVPSDDGYGLPSSAMYGDADGDGMFDDRDGLLGLRVQKYGRTTRLTHGEITGVNATVTVCYAVSGFTCTKSARFVDQLVIGPAGFSAGGDSGSLIVTDDANANPVALLFAGSASVTIANRIDLVLARFGVTIDGAFPPPPGPLTDIAITSVSAPAVVVAGQAASVSVIVKNFGNQDVSSFAVTVRDSTERVTVGSQSVAGLAAGGFTTLTFAWTPANAGEHALVIRHSLSDDRPANDQRVSTIVVDAPLTDLAINEPGVVGAATEGHVVNVSVVVRNAGNQGVGAFDVTLQDATVGATIGTQRVPALAAGSNATLSFPWDLTNAFIGVHTIVASHTLTDDDAENNRASLNVWVNPKPTDVALTGISGPARVALGETAHVLVAAKNVGELDIEAPFTIELTDATAGNVVVGTATVNGLAIGASTSVDIPWNTSGAAFNTHILMATSKLPDAQPNNNSVAIPIIVTPPADVAVTGVSGPGTVVQGSTAAIAVSVSNLGGQPSTTFTVTLSDATAGVTIGTQTISGGLAQNGGTTRTFSWNTAGATLGSHTLVATHSFSDGNSANNQASLAVAVSLPSTDVAVTAVSAPASVGKGSTPTISVTVQNVGGSGVGSFNVVLTDATAGMTIGTQAVSALAAGSSTTRSFGWNTTTAAIGSHTLVATQTLADDNASNNQRSVSVTVTQTPADIALAGITAPGSVTIGDTAAVVVTVQNTGGTDVTTSFDVVLTDGQSGNAVVGTGTVPGLASGASLTQTFSWNTASVTLGGHILTATQKLPDANPSNNARAVIVTVNGPSAHVGNLDGFATSSVDTWSATVRITAHDSRHNPVNGVTVRGSWNSGAEVSCQTSDAELAGTCTLTLVGIPLATRQAYFGLNGLTAPGFTYKPASNHDPDGSSNGFGIFVRR